MTLIENITKICENFGVTLYDTELTKEHNVDIFRIYIKKDGGVDVGTCEKISKLISPILDLTPPTGGRYFFEVSSPGLERKLKKLSHFEMSIGEEVKITIVKDIIDSDKKDIEKIDGILKSVDGKTISVQTEDGIKECNFNDIKKAKTVFKW